MGSYILKRLGLMVPTLLGIMLLNFAIIQAAPGGPVDRLLFQLTNADASGNATSNFTGAGVGDTGGTGQLNTQIGSNTDLSRSARGLDPDLIKEIEKLYGFDKPPLERFSHMIKSYLQFDFGESFFRNVSVTELIAEKLPTSISLGLWTTLLMYLISIPLGIKKAVRDGSRFDMLSSWIILIGYAIPSFLFAILLIILFAGGEYVQWFPLRGLTSEGFDAMPWWQQIVDYTWHLVLPITAMVLSSFASLTMLTKNSFLEELSKQYVLVAKAKGLSERSVLYGHVFRNAMLIVIAGFPSALLKIFFTSSLLIEVIFSLDGLGLLGFESAINRDYPVVFGTLFIFTLGGLAMSLLGDILYMIVDPRIDFERRAV
jgi:microcin C transport system permease protein